MGVITGFACVFGACTSLDDSPAQTFSINCSAHHGTVRLTKLTSTAGFKILLEDSTGATTDQTVFRYEPYRFDTADVNQDGQPEIIVGLIKATRFDPQLKKRLFILQIDQGYIRPMWLGSKVCQELIDFRVMADGTIQTLERTKSKRYAIGSYYWQSFGLTLKEYTHQEITYTDATQILKG